jgi:hypothetical protein
MLKSTLMAIAAALMLFCNFAQADCSDISDYNAQKACKGDCSYVSDYNMRKACEGDCSNISDYNTRKACQGDCSNLTSYEQRKACESCGGGGRWVTLRSFGILMTCK